MPKVFLIFLCIIFIPSPSYSGWFGPSPPELVTNETVTVQTGSITDISVAFNEWSGYRIGISLDPRVDFHGQEGKTLKWGETLGFKVTISSDGKTFFQYEANERLDHSLGWGFGVATVPIVFRGLEFEPDAACPAIAFGDGGRLDKRGRFSKASMSYRLLSR
jgi:hypothetical protein